MKPPRSQLPEPVAWRQLDVNPAQHDWHQLIDDIGTEVFHAYGQRVSQTGHSAATFSLGRAQDVQVVLQCSGSTRHLDLNLRTTRQNAARAAL